MNRKLLITLLLPVFAGGSTICSQQQISWDEAYEKADKKISELYFDEKKNFLLGYSDFFFYGVPEKGIPYLYLSDASQGVHIRKNLPDNDMVRQLEKSTAMPAPIMLAATFNPDLSYKYAKSVGEECRAGGIEVLLGPGVNITKNAQCGRNYEYLGEDPLLSAKMTSEYVKGMQSTGTAACLKHFIGNETEFYRRRSNSIIDDRAMHEVYLAPFRAGVDAGVAYVMTAYNRVNGEWAGQNKHLIDTILRGELGFKGSVMSDWRSVYDPVKVINSGQNTVMPGNSKERKMMLEAVKTGKITEKDIDRVMRPVLATGYAFGLYDREKYQPELLAKFPEHVDIAYQTAAEGVVLLRNNGILPLNKDRKILVIGKYLNGDPRLELNLASSSADVEGYDFVSLSQALKDEFGNNVTIMENPTDQDIAHADVVLTVVGTTDMESFERPFELDKEEEMLVRKAVNLNPNTIVAVVSGSGIRMKDWNDKAAAVLYAWYPGQIGMRAVTDILSGDLNPSGKLPMVIPAEFSDTHAKNTIPEGGVCYNKAPRAYNEALIMLYDIPYDDSVFVGHRWHEAKGVAPLYTFGHGLSYTDFEIRKPSVKIDKENLIVKFNLANTGKREGAEVVQAYVGEDSPTVARPKKEFKGFRKINLPAGATTQSEIVIPLKDLSFWNDATKSWQLNPGDYTLYLGNSADNTPHIMKFKINSQKLK